MITEDEQRAPLSQAVYLSGIHVPFWSVVGFMVKWAIAAIPALIILAAIEMGIGTLVSLGVIHYFAPGQMSAIMRAIFAAQPATN